MAKNQNLSNPRGKGKGGSALFLDMKQLGTEETEHLWERDRDRDYTVLGGGGEGEAAWEEKKEAQERPIRLAAALRHLASVPSPPHPPASGAIARSSPSATGQHHRPPFPAVLGGGVNAPAWLASFWFWYMKQKGTMLTVAV